MTRQIEDRPRRLPVVEFVTPHGTVAVGGCEPGPFADELVKTWFAVARDSWRGDQSVTAWVPNDAPTAWHRAIARFNEGATT